MKTAQEQHLLAVAEQRGLTVEFHHQRPGQKFHPGKMSENISHQPATKGGVTVCNLIGKVDEYDEATLATASARCSDHDNFNKGIGRVIALGRALKQFEAQ